MSKTNLQCIEAITLAEGLSLNQGLKRLNLSLNRISAAGVASLSATLGNANQQIQLQLSPILDFEHYECVEPEEQSPQTKDRESDKVPEISQTYSSSYRMELPEIPVSPIDDTTLFNSISSQGNSTDQLESIETKSEDVSTESSSAIISEFMKQVESSEEAVVLLNEMVVSRTTLVKSGMKPSASTDELVTVMNDKC